MQYFLKKQDTVAHVLRAVFRRRPAGLPALLRARGDGVCPPGRRFVRELRKMLMQLANRE